NSAPALLNQQLTNNQIDAALQFAPDFTEAAEVQGTMKKIVSVQELLQEAKFDPDSFYLTWNLADSWRDKNPGAVPKLVAAIEETVNIFETDDSVWPDLAKRSGVTDPKLLPEFIKEQRAAFKTNFGQSKLKPTQDLFDAIAQAVGTEALGQQKVDPAAFDFDSVESANSLLPATATSAPASTAASSASNSSISAAAVSSAAPSASVSSASSPSSNPSAASAAASSSASASR
ncbi:MAG: hypothetical protein JOZ39_04110, partial [Chloroflexi bacterium]|nr:hypothetical protein [Chloroflexota bacterium]